MGVDTRALGRSGEHSLKFHFEKQILFWEKMAEFGLSKLQARWTTYLESWSNEVMFAQTVASPVRPDAVCEGIWQNALFMLISPELCPADKPQDANVKTFVLPKARLPELTSPSHSPEGLQLPRPAHTSFHIPTIPGRKAFRAQSLLPLALRNTHFFSTVTRA